MCLAIPGKIISVLDSPDPLFRTARVSFGGIAREINLMMVPDAGVGDYVLVHVGVAISIVDEGEAARTLKYLEEIGELDEENND